MKGSVPPAQNRMAALLLLSRGQAPSWSESKQIRARRSHLEQEERLSNLRNTKQKQINDESMRRNWKTIFFLWILSTCIKILLFPAYKSTDFWVHRHWKAVTQHLPVAQWYWDDLHVETVHTTDYPPGFMLSEYLWGAIATFIMGKDDGCLMLKDDATLDATTSTSCIALMRTTVILSDTVWWIAAYAVSTAVTTNMPTPGNKQYSLNWKLFLLMTFHPALLFLDHVHFQYNGLLLGLLMLSLAFLMHANNGAGARHENDNCGRNFYHLAAAACFALLLTMKHLYITCSAWFGVYLARRFCCSEVKAPININDSKTRIQVAWKRLFSLVLTVGLVFLAPFAVFVAELYLDSGSNGSNFFESVFDWLRQLMTRLFPFERGLVHDYWAGNAWALYTGIVKVASFVARSLSSTSPIMNHVVRWLEWLQWSAVTPTLTLVFMLAAQIPGLRLAYRAAEQQSNILLLQSFTSIALVAFFFQFHAHEKAVLTSLIPCTVWAVAITADLQEIGIADKNRGSERTLRQDADAVWSYLWEFTALAVLGIFPLLYRPQELLLKLTCYISYLCVLQYWSPQMIDEQTLFNKRRRIGAWVIVLATAMQLETGPLHKLIYARFEFVPLALTSLVCAAGIGLLALELVLRTSLCV